MAERTTMISTIIIYPLSTIKFTIHYQIHVFLCFSWNVHPTGGPINKKPASLHDLPVFTRTKVCMRGAQCLKFQDSKRARFESLLRPSPALRLLPRCDSLQNLHGSLHILNVRAELADFLYVLRLHIRRGHLQVSRPRRQRLQLFQLG